LKYGDDTIPRKSLGLTSPACLLMKRSTKKSKKKILRVQKRIQHPYEILINKLTDSL
jgi:hypothetical protein